MVKLTTFRNAKMALCFAQFFMAMQRPSLSPGNTKGGNMPVSKPPSWAFITSCIRACIRF